MASEPVQVDVWFWPLDVAPDQLAGFTALLAADELDRADRFHQPLLRNRWIASRGQVRQLLSQVLGRPPQLIAFEPDAHGRPALAGEDTGLPSCNWSHSDAWGALALSFDARVGIDIEASRTIGEEDIEYALSPAEKGEIEGLTGPARLEAFFRFWTLKEAFMKGVGAGASLPLLLLFREAGQSITSVSTREVVAVEIVRALVGSIGLVASVPISTALAAAALGSATPTGEAAAQATP